MQILSALDAISPAFARMKLVLVSPFRVGRTWKLGATAYLSMVATTFAPFPLIYLALLPLAQKTGLPHIAAVLVSAVAGLTLLYLIVFYLCSRLRFAFFDIVLNRGEFVAPAWSKYGAQSFKWTVFKIAVGSIVSAAIGVPLVAAVRNMIAAFQSIITHMVPGQPLPPEAMAPIMNAYAGFWMLYIVFGLFAFASSLMSDFVVPSLALEDTSLGEAFSRLGKLIRNETGQFFAYAGLKLVLALAGYMAAGLAWEICMLVVLLVLWIIGVILHVVGVPIGILLGVGGVLLVAVYLYTIMLAFGPVMTFLESYMLYFLGGRYPMLGNLLEQSTPPPTVHVPPPSYYGQAYYPPPPPPPSGQ